MEKFEIREDFYLDGKKIKIISGGMHYFRVVPEYWRDRLEKLKALGCNTVETYIPWNLHEKEKGQFDFDGIEACEGILRKALPGHRTAADHPGRTGDHDAGGERVRLLWR